MAEQFLARKAPTLCVTHHLRPRMQLPSQLQMLGIQRPSPMRSAQVGEVETAPQPGAVVYMDAAAGGPGPAIRDLHVTTSLVHVVHVHGPAMRPPRPKTLAFCLQVARRCSYGP